MKAITDLDQMESLVARRYDLIWGGDTGYDVIRIKKSPTALYHKNAMRIKGKWYRTTRFPLTENGWLIPDEVLA